MGRCPVPGQAVRLRGRARPPHKAGHGHGDGGLKGSRLEGKGDRGAEVGLGEVGRGLGGGEVHWLSLDHLMWVVGYSGEGASERSP